MRLSDALSRPGLGAIAGYDAARNTGFDPVVRSAWDDARFTTLFLLFGLVALSCVATASDYGTGGILPTLQWTPRRGTPLSSAELSERLNAMEMKFKLMG